MGCSFSFAQFQEAEAQLTATQRRVGFHRSLQKDTLSIEDEVRLASTTPGPPFGWMWPGGRAAGVGGVDSIQRLEPGSDLRLPKPVGHGHGYARRQAMLHERRVTQISVQQPGDRRRDLAVERLCTVVSVRQWRVLLRLAGELRRRCQPERPGLESDDSIRALDDTASRRQVH